MRVLNFQSINSIHAHYAWQITPLMPILTLSVQKSMSLSEKMHFPKWRASSQAKPIANVHIFYLKLGK